MPSSSAGRPTRAAECFQSARAPVHGHGGADRERARSRPAARCWWKFMCRIRTARCCPACTPRSTLSSARPNAPLLIPERRADRSRRRHAGRGGARRITRCICRRSKSAATTATAWRWRPGSGKATCIANPGDVVREGSRYSRCPLWRRGLKSSEEIPNPGEGGELLKGR